MIKLTQNKIFLLLSALAGLGLAALIITALILNRRSPILPPMIIPKVILNLTANQAVLSTQDQLTLAINLATNNQSVTAVDVYLLFDPNFLEVVSFNRGQTFVQYPNLKLVKPGEILISGVNIRADQYAPDGLVAQVEFRVKKEAPAGQTTIKLSRQSVVAFEGRNHLDFSKSEGITIFRQ